MTHQAEDSSEALEKLKQSQRRYQKKYRANPVTKAKNRIYMRERSRAGKLKAVEYKGGICVDCSGEFHPAVFDFHHLDPSKKDLKVADSFSRKWEAVRSELDKCVMLCANCHRLRHHAQEQSLN